MIYTPFLLFFLFFLFCSFVLSLCVGLIFFTRRSLEILVSGAAVQRCHFFKMFLSYAAFLNAAVLLSTLLPLIAHSTPVSRNSIPRLQHQQPHGLEKRNHQCDTILKRKAWYAFINHGLLSICYRLMYSVHRTVCQCIGMF